MVLLNTYRVFLIGNLFFAGGFAWLAWGTGVDTPAGRALQVVLIATVCASVSYFAAGYWALRRIPAPHPSKAPMEAASAMDIKAGVFLLAVATLVFWYFTPAAALTELVRSLVIPDYQSAYSDLEIRLASSLAPKWVQIAYEAARRLLIPILLIQFYVVGDWRRMGVLANVVLVASTAFAAFYTLDRFIPALYAAFIVLGTFYHRGPSGLKSSLMYGSVIIALLCVVGFRSIQYGHLAEIQVTANAEIANAFEGHAESGAGEATPSTNGATTTALDSQKPAPMPDSPATAPPDATGASEQILVSGPVAPQTAAAENPAPAQGAPTANEAVSNEAKNSEAEPAASGRISQAESLFRYAALVLFERIVQSPLAMTLYSTESYDESNFRHWSSTRLFSLIGFGRYVEPLEPGELKHHDAFPVSYVGDLWRNGGLAYAWAYGLLIGLLLAALDDLLFRQTKWSSLRAVAVMGVAVLFYGNAFNATSILFFAGGVIMALMQLVGKGPVAASDG